MSNGRQALAIREDKKISDKDRPTYGAHRPTWKTGSDFINTYRKTPMRSCWSGRDRPCSVQVGIFGTRLTLFGISPKLPEYLPQTLARVHAYHHAHGEMRNDTPNIKQTRVGLKVEGYRVGVSGILMVKGTEGDEHRAVHAWMDVKVGYMSWAPASTVMWAKRHEVAFKVEVKVENHIKHELAPIIIVVDEAANEWHAGEVDAWWAEQGHRHTGHVAGACASGPQTGGA
ncbi:hypothetical protein HETIRDRAFT_120136 [Heterobasidion irregulare TC 32-1]|uniref:Uncharacterized protein n=1 Tax=Heterobasidion irregulare (strain TC 32-1) TaxID=747525 RepID=W4JXM7_HETIT|nr:uncharacterized protein HETIRDRAFT_120136 [Heterobasidion irregulare TC 32-1]ETW78278.1 hypothetical protein HETIRDRAFT_120136 [Heterobasidion irregulare TC 32-1]